MTKYSITYEEKPKPEDLRMLHDGLSEHAHNKKNMSPVTSFAYFIRDDGTIMGGCAGVSLYGCLHIGQLWVNELLRGQGYGAKLMQLAEDLARKSALKFLAVNTFDWQGLDFYKKLGFFVEFERTGFENNSIFYFLRKNL